MKPGLNSKRKSVIPGSVEMIMKTKKAGAMNNCIASHDSDMKLCILNSVTVLDDGEQNVWLFLDRA